MDTDQVNRLITDEVESIENEDVKRFIRDILAHERSYIDRENYEYKQKYKDLIKQYTGTDES